MINNKKPDKKNDVTEFGVTFQLIGKTDDEPPQEMFATPGGGIIKGRANARRAAKNLSKTTDQKRKYR